MDKPKAHPRGKANIEYWWMRLRLIHPNYFYKAYAICPHEYVIMGEDIVIAKIIILE
ncbi:hypothetical protein [Caedibacter taeniospiralis]|uniref:hypothetical protein n=1 Tax=Caedibacter taeniospiralis TaxID=28907 RepID=UPI001302B5E5|nr:hypothetical protein [Caedibacter taeniospiralis]